MTIRERIVSTHREHPDWPPSRIAEEIGCRKEYVRVVKQIEGLPIPTDRSRTGRPRKPPTVRIGVTLSESDLDLLEHMAAEAGMSPNQLGASLIRHVLIDDALAHSQQQPGGQHHG